MAELLSLYWSILAAMCHFLSLLFNSFGDRINSWRLLLHGPRKSFLD